MKLTSYNETSMFLTYTGPDYPFEIEHLINLNYRSKKTQKTFELYENKTLEFLDDNSEQGCQDFVHRSFANYFTLSKVFRLTALVT